MINTEILDGMARALYVTAWADWAERAGYSFSGCELTQVAPKTAPTARDHALVLYGRIEQANRPMYLLIADAKRADGIGEDDAAPENRLGHSYEHCFGFDLVMMALGHGVGWFDDHSEFRLEVPRFEFDAGEMSPNELDPEGEYPAARLSVGDEVWKTGAESYEGDGGESCELPDGSRGVVKLVDSNDYGKVFYEIEWQLPDGKTVTLDYCPAEDGTDYLEV